MRSLPGNDGKEASPAAEKVGEIFWEPETEEVVMEWFKPFMERVQEAGQTHLLVRAVRKVAHDLEKLFGLNVD